MLSSVILMKLKFVRHRFICYHREVTWLQLPLPLDLQVLLASVLNPFRLVPSHKLILRGKEMSDFIAEKNFSHAFVQKYTFNRMLVQLLN